MEVEGGDDLIFQPISRVVASLVGDAQGGESEAGGGDAGDEARIHLPGVVFAVSAVEYLAAGGVDLLGKIEAGGVFHFLEEVEVFIAEQSCVGRAWGCGLLFPCKRRRCQAGKKRPAQ